MRPSISNRAIAIANANPDAGYPIIAAQPSCGYGSLGQVEAAKEELKKLLDRLKLKLVTTNYQN